MLRTRSMQQALLALDDVLYGQLGLAPRGEFSDDRAFQGCPPRQGS
ncbi:hypothetical protein [Bradyrhizobium sp. USDA 4486]